MVSAALLTFPGENEPVNVNITDQHLNDLGQPVSIQVRDLLNQLPRYRGPFLELPSRFQDTAELVIAEQVYVAPAFIMSREKDRVLGAGILKAIVDGTELGADMLESLEEVGLMEFINRQSLHNRATYLRETYKIIAVFALCTMGCSTLASMPLGAIHALVGYFRTKNGLRWKRDLWGSSEVGIQCAREVILALARYTGDDTLFPLAVNHRMSTHGETVRTWKALQVSEHRIDKEVIAAYREFAKDSLTKPSEGRRDTMDMIGWLRSIVPDGSVLEALKMRERPSTLAQFLGDRLGKVTPDLVSRLRRMFRFSNFMFDLYSDQSLDVPCWPLITLEEIDSVADRCSSTAFKPSRARSRALPERLATIASEILEEGERGWPGQSGLFRELVRNQSGKLERRYCPTMVNIYRIMFRLPLRRAQVKRLDSGEGDARRFHGLKKRWEDNTGPHAGCWKRINAELQQRGYAFEFDESLGSKFTGIYVNTNKTGEPYYIPREDDEIHRILFEQREWVEKYIPVDSPTIPLQYVDGASEYPRKTIGKLPDIFPLFRLGSGKRWGSVL
ncbi:VPA1269 family protein [Rhizobium mayense]|uniref:VPA1269 family protein n=1 Tax=Rhizobium mayense TaxID=1312184 RepID=A0ABT7K7T7_9HYPH|nr:VPA1269 family protein [Rhizobium mayense]MDL2403204.1 VPA1269 family protein [Rhizobium mayense]